jgi:hypothetical protein
MLISSTFWVSWLSSPVRADQIHTLVVSLGQQVLSQPLLIHHGSDGIGCSDIDDPPRQASHSAVSGQAQIHRCSNSANWRLSGGSGRFDVGFGLAGEGCGGGLVGDGFLLPHLECFPHGAVADLVGFHVTVLGALIQQHPRQSGENADNEDCRDHEEDDQNGSAGSHCRLLALVERGRRETELRRQASPVLSGDAG